LELGWLPYQLHENHIKTTQYGIYGNLITTVCNKDSWLKNSHDEKTVDLKSLDKFGSFGTFTRIGYQIMKKAFTSCKPTNNLVSNSTHNLVSNSMAIIKSH
jgi:hypothetical protein